MTTRQDATRAANAPPAAAAYGRSRTGATSTRQSASAVAPVVCPLGHAASTMSAAAERLVRPRPGQERLEQLRGQRRAGEHHGGDERVPRMPAGEREGDQRPAEHGVARRVDEAHDVVGERVHARAVQRREGLEHRGVDPRSGDGRERRDADQRRGEREAEGGEQQGGRPAEHRPRLTRRRAAPPALAGRSGRGRRRAGGPGGLARDEARRADQQRAQHRRDERRDAAVEQDAVQPLEERGLPAS